MGKRASAHSNELERFIVDGIYNYGAENPAVKSSFNDTWLYLASRSKVCARVHHTQLEILIYPLKNGFLHGDYIKYPVTEIEKDLIGRGKGSSPLQVAAKNNNVEFFLLLIKAMSTYFSAETKVHIKDAVISMNISAKELESLTDYLDEYSKQHWYNTSSWRRELRNALQEKYAYKEPVKAGMKLAV